MLLQLMVRTVLPAVLLFFLSAASTACSDEQETLAGIDVLQRDGFGLLSGKRVGLITNHTGRTRDGILTAQVLHESAAVELTALFSPEHGFRGALDQSHVADAQDEVTGLKIFSLYGETRRPTAEMLANVDVLVFDIQDIGTRFYTYISTMGEAMQAAAEHKKGFVVLDRPNPINGVDVAGPLLDAGRESFVGFHTLPVRHGMTIGELALMFQVELQPSPELHVVRAENWRADRFLEDTGLMWVNPSPNMRCLNQALLYPGIGLLEFTNLSVGRGTDTPFEVIGAPWLDGRRLAAALKQRDLPGVVFLPIEFTPDSSRFEGTRCGGISIQMTQRDEFDPLLTGLTIACALRDLFPDDWEADRVMRLLGNERAMGLLSAGHSADAILQSFTPDLVSFRDRRSRYLLYERP